MQRTRTRMGAQEVMRCALCFRLAGWCAPCRLVCAMQAGVCHAGPHHVVLCCVAEGVRPSRPNAVARYKAYEANPFSWWGSPLAPGLDLDLIMRPTRFAWWGSPLAPGLDLDLIM